MNINRSTATFVAAALALMGAASESRAAAFALQEQGISGLGNAYAGAAAAAEDATTVWWNPAGMSRLGAGRHFSLGAAAIVPSTKFSDRGSAASPPTNTRLGTTGGDAGDAAMVPSAFFVMQINPNWHFGIGANVPFGLSTSYSHDWIGRFQGIESEVKTININPSVSYKFSDAASIGAGISYQRGEIDLLTAVNYSAAAFAAGGAGLLGLVGTNVEGQSKLSLDGDAWGFNVGGLWNVTQGTRLGLHYRSSLKYKMDGTVQFTGRPALLAAGLPDGNTRLSLKTPDSLSIALAHRLNDRWELLGDATWWNWSKIKQLPVTRDTGATLSTLTFNFDDAWKLSAGANYKLNNAWTLKLGVAYDQTPVPNAESRTVRLPDSDRYWLSLGAKWQVSRSGALDLGYTYIKSRNADINNDQRTTGGGLVNGSYKADVHIFGLQYQHSF
jgi:long-chain fatty acid transport protein